MDDSIIGCPRIGIHRELKFATEAYFRSEIDADELKRVVSQQRMEQWTRQRDAGAGFIPSNDFSLYDGMLDTAYMLNAIPRRYADLRLSDIDTYFAMARVKIMIHRLQVPLRCHRQSPSAPAAPRSARCPAHTASPATAAS